MLGNKFAPPVKVNINIFYDLGILHLDAQSMKSLAHIQSQDMFKNVDKQSI